MMYGSGSENDFGGNSQTTDLGKLDEPAWSDYVRDSNGKEFQTQDQIGCMK
jgi:hypothetical protein